MGEFMGLPVPNTVLRTMVCVSPPPIITSSPQKRGCVASSLFHLSPPSRGEMIDLRGGLFAALSSETHIGDERCYV